LRRDFGHPKEGSAIPPEFLKQGAEIAQTRFSKFTELALFKKRHRHKIRVGRYRL
jgi:hypothetical protein